MSLLSRPRFLDLGAAAGSRQMTDLAHADWPETERVHGPVIRGTVAKRGSLRLVFENRGRTHRGGSRRCKRCAHPAGTQRVLAMKRHRCAPTRANAPT